MAKTFNYGAGIWATKTGSSMAYNDQNDNYKPTPFSVTRDSIATRVNKQGLIEVVGKDKLRIDYTDSLNGVALLEPSRTNIIPRSEDIDTGWSKSNVSITNNNAISPDGSQNAAKITENTGTGSHVVYDTLTGSVTPSISYYFSCFVKKGTKRYFQLREGFSNTQINIDTNTFTVANSNNSTDYQIQNYGNDWYRISFKFTADSSGNSQFAFYLLDDSQNTSYTGDGTNYIYLWGAQIEAGSYATSYISTSGSTADRAADVANGAGNEQVFNDSEGVLFADIAALANDGTDRSLSLSSGSYSNRIELRYNSSSNGIRAFGIVGGAFQFDSSTSLTLANIKNQSKLALKYKQNDFALWADGFEVYTDLSGSTFPEGVLNKINFSDAQESSPFYGKTKEIGVYDAVLTDAELEALTSYTSFTNMANELNLTIK